MNERNYTGLDRLLIQLDIGVKGIAGGAHFRSERSPANGQLLPDLSAEDRAESARYMRINHCGEVCAQALYQGQALTAVDPEVAEAMQQAAAEEADHLAWCEDRIKQLGGRLSVLNPVWYLGSLAMGMAAGALGKRFNLGFLAATEEQVCDHLDDHLQRLPPADAPSRAILARMRDDEARHATHALNAGGAAFPPLLKRIMWQVSRIMTWSSYRM